MSRFREHNGGFRSSRRHGGKARRPHRQRSARPQLEVLEGRLLLAVFTVTNTNDSGAGSLRQAILDGNANHSQNTIAFNIGGGGVQTIRPNSLLPTITDPVIIDGTAQLGYAGAPLIVLNGANAGRNANGLTITAGSSTVKGLVVNGYSGTGILVSGAGGNVIAANYLGTDATGTSAVSDGDGIVLQSPNNTVGGTAASDRNLVSGNQNTGLFLSADRNLVQGNFIGTDITGNLPLGNPLGLWNSFGADNTIGGTTPGAGNLISGNGQGIKESGSGAALRTLVQGNFIGTNAAGTRAVGNGTGVALGGSTLGGTTAAARNLISGNTTYGAVLGSGALAEGNFIGTDVTGNSAIGNGIGVLSFGLLTVGGTLSGAGNVISGNTLYGIELTTSMTTVVGNLIGTNAAGTAGVGNGYGIYIVGDTMNTIGGTISQARNVISGNVAGVFIAAGSGNQIVGNAIGTDITGMRAIGNGDGIDLVAGGNTVGGTTAGAGNVISGNVSHGLAIAGSGNLVEGNLVGTDQGGTMRLGNATGIFLTGADNQIGGTVAGARNVISGSTMAEGTGLRIFGSGAAGNRVEGNYIGTNAAGTAALPNYGSGVCLEYGAMDNTIGGEAAGAGNLLSGNRGAGLYMLGPQGGNRVEGNFIGTDWTGRMAVGNGAGIAVQSLVMVTIGGAAPGDRNLISGNSDGVGIGGEDMVVLGNFIGTDVTGTQELGNWEGVSASDHVTIGGTAPGEGNLVSGNHVGLDLSGNDDLVEGNRIGTDLTGTVALGNQLAGIEVGFVSYGQVSQVTIGGTADGAGNLISGNAAAGVEIFGYAFRGYQIAIEGNRIGTDLTGTIALGNQQGVVISDASRDNVTIGGAESGAGNLISGNQQEGVCILGNHAVVEGNWIGTDVSGSLALGNGTGITIEGSNNTVGGTDAGAHNLISGNRGSGVLVTESTTVLPSDNLVLGNFIGTDSTGTRAVGNSGDGINLQPTFRPTTVGGTAPGAGNLISGNAGNGVAIFGSRNPSNLVQGNRIGVDVTGTNPLGNAGDGVSISGGFNPIGGTVTGAGNIIAFNGVDGVRVGVGPSNAVHGNSIYGHAHGLGIELVNNGNNNEPAPVLSDAKARATGTKVAGILAAQANTSFTLEFFSNTDCNPSGYGEGEVFLGTSVVVTDGAGNANFTAHLDAAVAPGQYLAATATDPRGNTSPFSQCVAVGGMVVREGVPIRLGRRGVMSRWLSASELAGLPPPARLWC